MSRATEIYAREFDSVLLDLPPRMREAIEAKIHDLGARLSTFPITGSKVALSIAFGSVITVSFTNLTRRKTFSIWSHSVIAGKSIADQSRRSQMPGL